MLIFLWMKLNADSANCYVNSWVFFHRSTEEIIALFISITFVLDAFKGIIKGKSCNNVFRCRSLLCFLVKGKYKAANMHDVCLFHVHSGASGGGGESVWDWSSPVSAVYLDVQNSYQLKFQFAEKKLVSSLNKWRNHINVAVKVFPCSQSL